MIFSRSQQGGVLWLLVSSPYKPAVQSDRSGGEEQLTALVFTLPNFCNLTATGRLFCSWAETKHALRWPTTPAPSSDRLLPAPHCNYLCIVFSLILPVSRKVRCRTQPPGPAEFRASSSSVDLQEEGCRDGRKLSQYSYISHREGFDLPSHCAY